MSFLRCFPAVFVIGQEYEILLNLKSFGICFLKIGKQIYFENNTGVIPSERTIVKIRVPQKVLDREKGYTVVFRETEERKSYFSTFNPTQEQRFDFKSIEKKSDVHIYHIADVHYRFEEAKKMASYFGEDTDLFIINGDIGEVETEDNFLEVCAFIGEISRGIIPVVFARGNHDARGRLAELYPKYFPVDGNNTYFTFTIGNLNGVVLDCGEDKLDSSEEYDASKQVLREYRGINRFHIYRQQQLEFLKKVDFSSENKLTFAVSHMCPVKTTEEAGSVFDIERDTYEKWNIELERAGIKFMLCGHYHKAFVLHENDEISLIPHKYPIIVGSALSLEGLMGAAIILNKDKMEVCITNEEKKIIQAYEIMLK